MGHLTVAQGVLSSLEFDELWLLPCFKQAEGKKIESAEHRLAMLRLACKTLSPRLREKIKIKHFEVRFLRRKNYTADTVRFLQKRFPSTRFTWVFGSELVKDFPRWTKWRILRTLLPLVIYPRPGFKKPSKKFVASLGAQTIFLPHSVRQSRVSSTKARAFALTADKHLRLLVPQNVFDYIRKHKLYGWK